MSGKRIELYGGDLFDPPGSNTEDDVEGSITSSLGSDTNREVQIVNCLNCKRIQELERNIVRQLILICQNDKAHLTTDQGRNKVPLDPLLEQRNVLAKMVEKLPFLDIASSEDSENIASSSTSLPLGESSEVDRSHPVYVSPRYDLKLGGIRTKQESGKVSKVLRPAEVSDFEKGIYENEPSKTTQNESAGACAMDTVLESSEDMSCHTCLERESWKRNFLKPDYSYICAVEKLESCLEELCSHQLIGIMEQKTTANEQGREAKGSEYEQGREAKGSEYEMLTKCLHSIFPGHLDVGRWRPLPNYIEFNDRPVKILNLREQANYFSLTSKGYEHLKCVVKERGLNNFNFDHMRPGYFEELDAAAAKAKDLVQREATCEDQSFLAGTLPSKNSEILDETEFNKNATSLDSSEQSDDECKRLYETFSSQMFSFERTGEKLRELVDRSRLYEEVEKEADSAHGTQQEEHLQKCPETDPLTFSDTHVHPRKVMTLEDIKGATKEQLEVMTSTTRTRHNAGNIPTTSAQKDQIEPLVQKTIESSTSTEV